MVPIDEDVLLHIVRVYSIDDRVVGYRYLVDLENSEEQRVKKIIRVLCASGSSYILKIVRELEHPCYVIEQQSRLSETYRTSCIAVPKRYHCGPTTYVYMKNLGGDDCCITVEEDFGPSELEVINAIYVSEMGSLMASMHLVSEKKGCHIELRTLWDFFDENSDIMRGYRAFSSLPERYELRPQDLDLHREITESYLVRREALQSVWPKLPRYAVQGDFSTNNFIVRADGTVRGVIDFNVAGDDVLVNDLITEGIFICYIMDLDERLTEGDRQGLFDIFVASYRRVRVLSDHERSVMNSLSNKRLHLVAN